MNDIRRSVLWAVFLMSLFMLYEAWNKHTGQPGLFSPPTPATVQAPANGASAALPAPGALASAGAAPTAAAPAASAASGELIEVGTDLVKATFDTRGATLVRLELMQQVDQTDRSKNVVLFQRGGEHTYMAQTGLVGAPGLPTHLSNFKLVSTDRAMAAGKNDLVLRFESAPEGGATLAKTYTFKRGSYVIDVKHEVSNSGAAELKPQLYQQLVRDGTIQGNTNMFAGPVSFTGAAFYTDAEKFQKIEFADIEKAKAEHAKAANDGWVSVVQHYFVSAWLNPTAGPREFFSRKIDTNLYAAGVLLPVPAVAPGATVAVDSQLMAGPQEEKKLEALAPGLDLVKDYGIFAIIAKPLFWLLDKIHSVVGNWGWAIVLLVVLLKAAFFSLNASAYKSMAKMKAINPRVQEMRERLKDKPQQMQQEMMKMYREEKVNPLGGCLPIVVQIPVFIALYWVLLSSVEMRNAPWIGWVKDLSVPDPLFILPVVMTASTMLQTWLNPTPPDPVQAKMMWIMPLIFSVMFFFFPAGLVLYWVTNNLLSIAQQYVINKKLGVA